MTRPLPRLLPLSLLATALGGCSAPVSLALLVVAGNGATPASLEVRAYDGAGLLASQTIQRPELPGVIHVRSLPAAAGELRLVVLGRDDHDVVASIGANHVSTPLPERTELPLTLDADFHDGDGDGVPDALDGCPTIADADQKSAAGYGHGPGDACSGGDMGGAAPAACPARALCDSFDDTIDPSLWTASCEGTASGCVSIDRQRAYRGAGSLHVRLDETAAQKLEWAVVTETRTFPADDLFARAFVWVPGSTSRDVTAIFAALQSDTPYNAVTLQLEGSGFSMYSGIKGKEKYAGVAGVMPRDKWFCLEWELKVGAQGAGRVWVDGALLSAPLLSADTTSSPRLGQLELGLSVQATANAVPAREIWFDELVVGAARVGCQ